MARIRKALVAGFGAGLAAGVAVLAKAGNFDRDTLAQAAGAFIVAAVPVFWATYATRNAGSDIGVTGSTTTR
jgi:hypothetical protein